MPNPNELSLEEFNELRHMYSAIDPMEHFKPQGAAATAQGDVMQTATPTEQPEPTSSPEGNEGIKTTGGPTGAINIPTQPTVPDTGSGGISEGDYKLTRIT